MAVDDAYDLAYRASVRALDHQLTLLTELRGRASVLLAAGSITVSMLGQRTSRLEPLGWLALACFVLLSIAVLVIVWPRSEWRFDADPQAVLAAHISDGELDAVELSIGLIAHMAHDRRRNARRLAYVARAFRIGACLLASQMVLTVMATGGTV